MRIAAHSEPSTGDGAAAPGAATRGAGRAPEPPPEDPVRLEIERIFREILLIEPPLPQVDLIESGLLDSLTLISLIVEIEHSFQLAVPPDELRLENLGSIERLVELVEGLSRGPDPAHPSS